ncbi:restriction endonuclease subunit S [Escherichia coli]
MVPKGWELSSIGKISDVSSGGTPSRNNEAYWNGNIPWVTTAEVQFKIIEDTVEKITEEGLANSSAKLFPAGTILMAMYGQGKTREGANKRENSSRLTQSFHFFMFEPIFSPVNALNQPI